MQDDDGMTVLHYALRPSDFLDEIIEDAALYLPEQFTDDRIIESDSLYDEEARNLLHPLTDDEILEFENAAPSQLVKGLGLVQSRH